MKQIIAGFVVWPLIVTIYGGLIWWSGGWNKSSDDFLIGMALFIAVLIITVIALHLTGII